MTSSSPFVSVVIPVYKDAKRLQSCLQALSCQTYSEDLYEVIVVDNGSPESPANVVALFPFASLFFEAKIGSYAARNKGISQARGEIVAFTDSDCRPEPEWLEKGVKRLTGEPGIGSVGGKVEFFFQQPGRPSVVELYDSMTSLDQKRYVEVAKFAATANLFTFNSVLKKIGPFLEQLKSGGDYEWGNRLVANGYSIVYADDAVVKHPARASLGQLCRKHLRVVGGGMQLCKRRSRRYRQFVINQIKDTLLIGQTRLVLNNRQITIRQKAGLLLLLRFIGGLKVYERFRILCGGRPKRH